MKEQIEIYRGKIEECDSFWANAGKLYIDQDQIEAIFREHEGKTVKLTIEFIKDKD